MESFNNLFVSENGLYTQAEELIWKATLSQASYVILATDGSGFQVANSRQWAENCAQDGELIVSIPILSPECEGEDMASSEFGPAVEQFTVNFEWAEENAKMDTISRA